MGEASVTVTPTNMASSSVSADNGGVEDRVVALEMEVGKIRSQLSEILRSLQKYDQELERGRGVDAELESLLSSFTANSDDNPDPLAKQLQPIQHYTGIIAPNAVVPLMQSRSFSVPPSMRLPSTPLSPIHTSPSFSPPYQSPFQDQFAPLLSQPAQLLPQPLQQPPQPPQPLQQSPQPQQQPAQPPQQPAHPLQWPLQPPQQPAQPPQQPAQPPLNPAHVTLAMPAVFEHVTNKEYGKVAVALARYSYSGREEMKRSTITGADNTAMLNPWAMQQLKQDVRGLYMDLSETEFELIWRSKCLSSIAAACWHLRYNRKKN